jgi:hypothetical protein
VLQPGIASCAMLNNEVFVRATQEFGVLLSSVIL